MKIVSHGYMGGIEGNIHEEVSDCQTKWTVLPKDVYNLHGRRRRCGGLLQMVDQVQ